MSRPILKYLNKIQKPAQRVTKVTKCKIPGTICSLQSQYLHNSNHNWHPLDGALIGAGSV
jgi:hypothetical protein